MRTFLSIGLMLGLLCIPVRSQTKYIIRERGSLISASRMIALSQIGYQETRGENRGEPFKSYLSSVGLSEGNPYCGAGQYYCYQTASRETGTPIRYIPRSGWAYSFWLVGVRYGTKSKYVPRVDDFIIWKSPTTSRGHVERIIRVRSMGWVETIAFNSSRNGIGGVYRKTRNIYHHIGILSIKGLTGVVADENR